MTWTAGGLLTWVASHELPTTWFEVSGVVIANISAIMLALVAVRQAFKTRNAAKAENDETRKQVQAQATATNQQAAARAAETNRRVTAHAAETNRRVDQVRKEVTNGHESNIRDDITQVLAKADDALRLTGIVKAYLETQEKDIRGLRTDISTLGQRLEGVGGDVRELRGEFRGLEGRVAVLEQRGAVGGTV